MFVVRNATVKREKLKFILSTFINIFGYELGDQGVLNVENVALNR